MIRPLTARASALFTLPSLALAVALVGCADPSGTGGTVDSPSDAPVESEQHEPGEPEADAPVLAAADSAANDQDTEGQPALEDQDEAAEGEGEAAEAADEPPEPEAILEPRRVLIVGSSLAATGLGAVLEDTLDANPDVVCYRKGKSASGLARPDFYDWFDQGKRQVEFRKPDLVIVIMGANDGQDLTPWKGSRRVRWDSEGWPEAYRGRVDQFLAELAAPIEEAEGAKVMWLGLPKVPSPSLERKLKVIREIHEQGVGALGDGGLYLDTTQYLVDEQGALLRSAEVKGKQRELRSEDGVHFTMSGCEYLAAKIYPEVLEALGLPVEASE
ncbi:hypothetical protein ENSA5_52700 [Enhygromyxa salina]|uniref:DUF459 domain-containing protein n=1 Tax=Enhygromyxa salina TaxID=215803 RepID=A0A2S9XG51_9BACT|nr:DUF459 domain-containing protein [Enhygromyxa salina]PRP91832.1 hypothetical protein ENSA5_52700 [Enhygromyxa salina]